MQTNSFVDFLTCSASLCCSDSDRAGSNGISKGCVSGLSSVSVK